MKKQKLTKNVFLGVLIIALVSGTGLAAIDFELGDSRITGYDGGLSGGSISLNNTEKTMGTGPVCKFISTTGSFLANQNFNSTDLTGYLTLTLDLYADGSGAYWRISLWSNPLGNPFLYKDITMDWVGWRSFTIRLDGNDGGFNFWANGTSYTREQALTQITVFSWYGPWNSKAATFYFDNVKISDVVSDPKPENGDANVALCPKLSWKYTTSVTGYDVYLGTDSAAVDNATTATSGIYLGSTDANSITFTRGLRDETTYYWRVDFKVNAKVTKGKVWKFTTCLGGDFDGDGVVGYKDFRLLTIDWLGSSNVADIDGSGKVNFKDFSFFAVNWQKSVTALVINEFMADNSSNYSDPQGDFDDWIEIYNPTDYPVYLGGMYITDDLTDLTKYQIPTGFSSQTTVPAHGFLILWADEDMSDGAVHLAFKLSAGGEEIALVAKDGITVIDSLTFASQLPDVSFGSYPDGSDERRYFGIPTPGAANNDGVYLGVAPTPEFSRSSGIFTDAFPLTISVDSNTAVIRYTTDHNIPTKSSPVYTGPITISSTKEIIARSFEPGFADSEVKGKNFVKVSNEVADFNSNLPVVILDSFGYNIDGENSPTIEYPYRNVYAIVIGPNDAGRATVKDEPVCQTRGGMRVRGQTSAGYPKRQYKFESWNYMGSEKDVSFLGMPADSDWIIQGPYNDKSLIRNYLTYRLARDMGDYAVRTELCEAFNNQGDGVVTYDDYAGVYVFMERIKIGGGRLQSEKLGPTDNTEPKISGGYIIKQDKGAVYTPEKDKNIFDTAIYFKHLQYDEPDTYALTQAQKDWIKNYCNQAESALQGSNFADPVNGYQKYIEPNSFIDYFIIAEISKNVDAYRLSDYMFKPRNGRIQRGPVWDYDLAWANANYYDGWLTEGWQHIINSPNDGSAAWLRRMFEDDNFYIRCIDRWYELREGILETGNMMSRIQGYANELEEAQQRNFVKWKVLGVPLWPNWFVGNTYEEEIDFMKQWVNDRLLWIDGQFRKPPRYNQDGGHIDSSFKLTIVPDTEPGGTIYYTTDGNDPRLHGGAVNPNAHIYTSPISFTKSTQVKSRELDNGEWTALNEATFSFGAIK